MSESPLALVVSFVTIFTIHFIGPAVVVLLFAPTVTRRLCRRWGLEKPNFQNQIIPASVGLTFLQVAAVSYGLVLPFWQMRPHSLAFFLVSVGFGLLGLLDDRFGNRGVGGFRGHFRALLARRPTSGSAKMLGGGLLALGAAYLLDGFSIRWLVDALVIALAANALNLLDTRPGRALFGFGVLLLPPLLHYVLLPLGGHVSSGIYVLPVVWAAWREWKADASGRAMMGDTGSNLLGAVAGLGCVCVLPFWGRVVLMLVLLGLNALAERVSLSALIAKSPALAAFDGGLGVR